MNKLINKAQTGLISILMLATSIPVMADTAQCELAINATELATQGTEFLGKNTDKTESGLLSKLAAARLKLTSGKYNDVVMKLTDYHDSVISMANAMKPKIAVVDAYGSDGINDGVGGLDGFAFDAITNCTL